MYQSFKLVKGRVGWTEFVDAIMKRFGKNEGLDFQEEFNKLSQTGSLLDYIERFEELKSLIICKNTKLGEDYFIFSFISGLKAELKPMVRLMKPQILLDAMEIAQFQEQTIDVLVKKHDFKRSNNWNKNGDKKYESTEVTGKKT